MQIVGLIFFFIIVSVVGQSKNKKVPSISYRNVISCYPELKNKKLEFDIDLTELKKTIEEKYPTIKAVLRYRKVLFTAQHLGSDKHRLTISLQKWVKGVPEYDFYLERLDKDNIAEMVNVPKEKFKNPIKEVPQKYLIDIVLIEDESLWLDTKPNKMKMSYKTSNDSVIELELSGIKDKSQLKCESKNTQGVLCLCLKQ